MLTPETIEISQKHLQRADKLLSTADELLRFGDYESANNRAYYSMFNAICALLILDGVMFKKHA